VLLNLLRYQSARNNKCWEGVSGPLERVLKECIEKSGITQGRRSRAHPDLLVYTIRSTLSEGENREDTMNRLPSHDHLSNRFTLRGVLVAESAVHVGSGEVGAARAPRKCPWLAMGGGGPTSRFLVPRRLRSALESCCAVSDGKRSAFAIRSTSRRRVRTQLLERVLAARKPILEAGWRLLPSSGFRSRLERKL